MEKTNWYPHNVAIASGVCVCVCVCVRLLACLLTMHDVRAKLCVLNSFFFSFAKL